MPLSTHTFSFILPTGQQSNGESEAYGLSDNGRYLVFGSTASNIVAGDSNSRRDVFVYDTLWGGIELASRSASGTQGAGHSGPGVLSADGRTVAFESVANNLASEDHNGTYRDVFVKNLETGAVTLASCDQTGAQYMGDTVLLDLSADGSRVLMRTNNGVNGWDVIVKDLASGQLYYLLGLPDLSAPMSHVRTFGARFMPDETRVLVTTDVNAAGDQNDSTDIYLFDTATGDATLVSVGLDGEAAGDADILDVSADGTRVLFAAADPAGAGAQVYMRNLSTGVTTLVSKNAAGEAGDSDATDAAFSPDATRVVFSSFAGNLVAGDDNASSDVFIANLATGDIEAVSTTATGELGNNASLGAHFSADGRTVYYTTYASNLVAGDTNGRADVVYRDVSALTPLRLSISGPGAHDEGDTVQFTVTLSAASSVNVYADYATGAGSAISGDFAPVSGQLVFAPGETQKTISVVLNNDATPEVNETFVVSLANAVNADIADAVAQATIRDVPPSVPTLAAQAASQTIDWRAAIQTATAMTMLSYGDADLGQFASALACAKTADSGFDDLYSTYFTDNVVEPDHAWRILDDRAQAADCVAAQRFAEMFAEARIAHLDSIVSDFTGGGLYHAYSVDDTQFHVAGGQVYGNSNALVAYDEITRTLALTFRGTDGEDAAITAGQAFTADGSYFHYAAFRPLIEAVLALAADPAANVEHVVVAGHSLGGAMADLFAAIDARYFAALANCDLAVVSLASPGLVASSFSTSGAADRFGSWDGSVASVNATTGALTLTAQGAFYMGLAQNRDRVYWSELGELWLQAGCGIGAFLTPVATLTGNVNFTAQNLVLSNIFNDDVNYHYSGLSPDSGFGAHHNENVYWANATEWASSRFFTRDPSVAPRFGTSVYDHMASDWWKGPGPDDRDATALNGDGTANIILGLAGDDEILGLAGDDSLDGGAGNDILNGGAGADNLDGRAGVDTASYADAPSAVTVSLATTARQNTGGAGADMLFDIENLIGSAHSDQLTGDTHANRLDGRAGRDVLKGGDGDDVYVVDISADIVTELANEGVDTVETTATWRMSANVENLVLIGVAAIGGVGNDFANDIRGNDEANVISGLGGGDVIHGGAGNDTLDGGAGDDFVYGEAGNDGFRAGTGADLFDGGADVDAVNYSTATSAVVYLDGSGVNAASAAGDVLVGIENLVGSATGTDIFVGDANANRLTGNGGNDRLTGRAGADILEGGDGNDRLVGEEGADVMTGGAGIDTFVFNLAPNAGGFDRITDFEAGIDKLEIDASLFGGGLVAGGAVNLVSGSTPTSAGFASGVFLYDTDDGFLYWDADGAAAGARLAIVRLQNLPALATGDFTVVA